jgi:hypothetical protein
MKRALIDPNASVLHIVSWTEQIPHKPITEEYPDSARVCEVIDNDFPVAEPLFWVDCADDVVADQFWYNKTNQQIQVVVNIQPPAINNLQENTKE